MRIEDGKIEDLNDRDDRTVARIASRATMDTIHGGARTMVLAKRLERMGSKLGLPGVVGAVYSASTGKALPEYRVCMCPECGQTVLGEEAAVRCCAFLDEPEKDFIDDEDDEFDLDAEMDKDSETFDYLD